MTATHGNYELVDTPARLPGVDFLTRSGQGPFVDTGIDIRFTPERRGVERVYLSVDTIRDLAERAGIVDSPGNKAAYEAELINRGKLEAVKEHLGERIADLADVLHRIAGDGSSRHDRLGGAA